MSAFGKWLGQYGADHPMYYNPSYREQFLAKEAYLAGLEAAAKVCDHNGERQYGAGKRFADAIRALKGE